MKRPGSARKAARDRHRIVAAVTWPVDLGMGNEGRSVARVLEPPDGTVDGQFEVRPAEPRLALGEIGDRIKPADGEPGMGIDLDLFVGRRPRGPGRGKSRENRQRQGKTWLSPLPCCSHSSPR